MGLDRFFFCLLVQKFPIVRDVWDKLFLIMMWAMTESHSGWTQSGIIPSSISHSWKNEGGIHEATSSHWLEIFLTLSLTLQRPETMSSNSSSETVLIINESIFNFIQVHQLGQPKPPQSLKFNLKDDWSMVVPPQCSRLWNCRGKWVVYWGQQKFVKRNVILYCIYMTIPNSNTDICLTFPKL